MPRSVAVAVAILRSSRPAPSSDAHAAWRFMAAAKKSEELKLTVMSGAQRRAQKEYVETIDKIKNGEIGDVVATYAYWVGSPVIQNKDRDPKFAEHVFVFDE